MSKTKIEIRADIPVIVFPCGGCRPCGHAEYEIIKELENLTICSGCGHLSWDEIKPPHKACCPDSGCSSDIPVRDFIFNIWEEVCKLKCEKAELINLIADINRHIKSGSFNIPMYENYYMSDVDKLLKKHTGEARVWLSIPI